MNNFDNKIKAKFDDFEPAFQEQDWQSFAPLLHPKIPFWLRVRKPFGYALAASTLLFLVYQNNQLSIENKQLHADIKLEKQQITGKNDVKKDTKLLSSDSMQYIDNQSIISDKIVNNSEKRTKNQVKKEPGYFNIPIKKNTFFDENKVRKSNENIANENNQTIVKHSNNNSNIQTIEDNQTIVKHSNNNSNIQTIEDNQTIVKHSNNISNIQTIEDNQTIVKHSNNISNIQTIEDNQTIVKHSNNISNIQTIENIENIALLNTLFPVVSNEKAFIFPVPEKVAYTAAPQLTNPKRETSRFGIGLSANKREDFAAIGIVAAYNLTKHFQLNLGVEFGESDREKFRDNDDFRNHHKEDFKNKFPQPIPSNGAFTDIRMETKSVSLPFSLYYTIPVYKKIVAVTSLGTSLRLNSTQRFDYQYSEGLNQTQQGSLPVIQKAIIFQNISISAGLQTTWKRLTFRAEPTCFLDVNQEKSNRKQRYDGGFRAQIFYDF